MHKYILALLFFLPLPTLAQSVVINEIAWMGTQASGNDEWIELYNTSKDAIDLSGWQLQATDGSPVIILEGIIEAESFFILERTDDQTLPNITADQIYSGSFSNSGEWMQLLTANGTIHDELNASDGWPGGDNTTKQTLERTGTTWQTSETAGGTPRQSNSTPAKSETPEDEDETSPTNTPEKTQSNTPDAATKNDIVINEVFSNPSNKSAHEEFIELKNKTHDRLDVSDFYITTKRGQRYTIENTTIRPTGIFLLKRSITNLALDNQSEKISLYSPAHKLIHTISITNAPVDKSYQRDIDDIYHWEEPSPRLENQIISRELPVVDVDIPKTAQVGELLQFNANDSFDPNGNQLTFNWDFGNGRTATEPSPWQIYLTEGTYDITVTATSLSHSSSTTRTITIHPKPEIPQTIEQSLQSETTSTATTTPTVLGVSYTPADVLISEFLPNPEGSDADDEFIELFNNSNQIVDIGHWQLDDIPNGSKAFTFPSPTILYPFSYTAFFREQTGIALNNSADEIILTTPDGIVIDGAKYQSSKESHSYIRDTDNEWLLSSTPTPNEINSANEEQAEKIPTTTSTIPSEQKPQTQNTEQVFKDEQKGIPYKTLAIVAAITSLAILGNHQQKKKFHSKR